MPAASVDREHKSSPGVDHSPTSLDVGCLAPELVLYQPILNRGENSCTSGKTLVAPPIASPPYSSGGQWRDGRHLLRRPSRDQFGLGSS